jgi:hypothetical protein
MKKSKFTEEQAMVKFGSGRLLHDLGLGQPIKTP